MCVCGACVRACVRARVCVLEKELGLSTPRQQLVSAVRDPRVQQGLFCLFLARLASLVSEKSTETDSSVIKVLVDCPEFVAIVLFFSSSPLSHIWLN